MKTYREPTASVLQCQPQVKRKHRHIKTLWPTSQRAFSCPRNSKLIRVQNRQTKRIEGMNSPFSVIQERGDHYLPSVGINKPSGTEPHFESLLTPVRSKLASV